MIKEFIKKHPVISAAIGGGIMYTIGKKSGIIGTEMSHANELNQTGSTTFYDAKNDKYVTTILKPVVEAATEEVAE